MRLVRIIEKLRDETSQVFSYIPYKPNCVHILKSRSINL